ncbi:CDGSH iron-sulfur domain-containing protein [Nocardia sp. NBC_01388]
MVEGPVELVRADGTTVCSDRFLVALCMCRRSKSFPLCDTSHRKRARRTAE